MESLQQLVIERLDAAGVGGRLGGLVVGVPRDELEHLIDGPAGAQAGFAGVARWREVRQGELLGGQLGLDGMAEDDPGLVIAAGRAALEQVLALAALDGELRRPPAAAPELLQALDGSNVVVRQDDDQLVPGKGVVVKLALGGRAGAACRRHGGGRLGDGGVGGEGFSHGGAWAQRRRDRVRASRQLRLLRIDAPAASFSHS